MERDERERRKKVGRIRTGSAAHYGIIDIRHANISSAECATLNHIYSTQRITQIVDALSL